MSAQLAQQESLETGQMAEHRQCLTFMLDGEVYGIDILNIKELIDYGDLTHVPMMPGYIRGVINLRGNVVPVIDLAVRFGGRVTEITKRTAIVIIELADSNDEMSIGVIVDAVNEVLDLPEKDIEPAPAFGTRIRTDFIAGMGKVKEKFLILLDVNRVLSIEELSVLDAAQNKGQEILDQPEPGLA